MKNSGSNDYQDAAFSEQRIRPLYKEPRHCAAEAQTVDGELIADGRLNELLGLESAGAVVEVLRNSLLDRKSVV